MKTSSQCLNCSRNFCILLLPDAENMASVADQDSNGAGTLSLGAAVASTPTRGLFEEIDGQVRFCYFGAEKCIVLQFSMFVVIVSLKAFRL